MQLIRIEMLVKPDWLLCFCLREGNSVTEVAMRCPFRYDCLQCTAEMGYSVRRQNLGALFLCFKCSAPKLLQAGDGAIGGAAYLCC